MFLLVLSREEETIFYKGSTGTIILVFPTSRTSKFVFSDFGMAWARSTWIGILRCLMVVLCLHFEHTMVYPVHLSRGRR